MVQETKTKELQMSCNNCERCCEHEYSKLAFEYGKFKEVMGIAWIGLIIMIYYFLGGYFLLVMFVAWFGLWMLVLAYAGCKDIDIHDFTREFHRKKFAVWKLAVGGKNENQ